jgi:hypothetical protein
MAASDNSIEYHFVSTCNNLFEAHIEFSQELIDATPTSPRRHHGSDFPPANTLLAGGDPSATNIMAKDNSLSASPRTIPTASTIDRRFEDIAQASRETSSLPFSNILGDSLRLVLNESNEEKDESPCPPVSTSVLCSEDVNPSRRRGTSSRRQAKVSLKRRRDVEEGDGLVSDQSSDCEPQYVE